MINRPFKIKPNQGLFVLITSFICLGLIFPKIAQGQINIPGTNSSNNSSLSTSFRAVETNRIGNIIYAPIVLDGREVLTIASPLTANRDKNDNLSIDFRVNQIENQLKALVKRGDPKTVQLFPATYNNQTVILAKDKRYFQDKSLIIGTVTESDAQFYGRTIPSLAEEAATELNKALKQAWSERKPEYLQRQTLTGLGVFLLLGLLTWLFWHWQHSLYKKLQALQAAKPLPSDYKPMAAENSEATQRQEKINLYQALEKWRRKLNLLVLSWRLGLIFVMMFWVLGLIISLRLFPETRWLGLWLQGKPSYLLAIWLGMYFFQKIGDWIVNYSARIWRMETTLYTMDSQRQSLRISTTVAVLSGIIPVLATLMGLILSLVIVGIPLTTLLTGLGVISFAISFAAQSLIKSMINGLMILWNDPYGVGDSVALGNQAEGLVEDFNLFYTQLRSADGDLITIANADISLIRNKSKDWSRVNFTIQVDYGADLDQALAVIAQTARELYHDPQWAHQFIEPPEVLGVDELNYSGMLIRIWFKVQPLKQWLVGREFRRRLKIALDKEQIRVGIPQTILVNDHPNSARLGIHPTATQGEIQNPASLEKGD